MELYVLWVVIMGQPLIPVVFGPSFDKSACEEAKSAMHAPITAGKYEYVCEPADWRPTPAFGNKTGTTIESGHDNMRFEAPPQHYTPTRNGFGEATGCMGIKPGNPPDESPGGKACDKFMSGGK